MPSEGKGRPLPRNAGNRKAKHWERGRLVRKTEASMNLEIFTRQLQLLQLLTGNTELTVREICDELDISARTFHRYIAMFRAAGFEVASRRSIYTIFQTSPFYASIADKMQLRGSEVNTLVRMLDKAGTGDPSIASLRRKFSNLYGVDFSLKEARADDLLVRNTALLQKAIRSRRQVLLHDYESPHRQTLSDRLVEPFRLLPATASVRCYELQSNSCKTFKIARIRGEVELCKENWRYPTLHVNYYTDLFGFSGEERSRVILRLTMLAAQVLCEEFGVKDSQLLIDGDNTHRIFSTYVCSPVGIGRFVMGLLNDVEIVRGPELQAYVDAELLRHLNPTACGMASGESNKGHNPTVTSEK